MLIPYNYLPDEFRSTEIETSQWVCGKTDYVLVTTPPYIKGFECEAIIDFTSKQDPEVISRATIRIIKVSGMRNEIMALIGANHDVIKGIIEFDDEFFLTKMISMQDQGVGIK